MEGQLGEAVAAHDDGSALFLNFRAQSRIEVADPNFAALIAACIMRRSRPLGSERMQAAQWSFPSVVHA